jgi:hypothetical protein
MPVAEFPKALGEFDGGSVEFTVSTERGERKALFSLVGAGDAVATWRSGCSG